MSRWCERCRQVCEDTDGLCPRCGTQAVTTASADVTPAPVGQLQLNCPGKSDSEIDLGAPVAPADGLSGPPSGASFVSWGALLKPQPFAPTEDVPPVVMGSMSSARILLDQSATGAEEAVDLGSHAGSTSSGPPSGASFVSWGALVPAGVAPGENIQAGSHPWRHRLLLALAAALLAAVASFALWSAAPSLGLPAPSPDEPAPLDPAP